MRILVYLSLITLTFSSFACGSDDGVIVVPEEGVFVDSPVAGLSYQTASQSGVTDPNGIFQFLPGESVSFFLGDVPIGEAPGQDVITPFQLFPGLETVPDARLFNRFLVDLGQRRVTAADQITNVAVFLQSLDDDGEVDNGIQIPEPVSEILRGIALPLDREFGDFDSLLGLLTMRRNGFAQGLWGGGRPLPSAGRALDHLFNSLASRPPMFRPVSTLSDDLTSTGNLSRQIYDAEGRLIREEFDSMNDGSLDSTLLLFYDEFDHIVRSESDNLTDALPKSVGTSEFDARGNVILQTRDSNDDGTPEFVTRVFYDEFDRQIRSETDTDDPGEEPNSISRSFYDDQGNLIRSESDTDANGDPETATESEYDAEGRVTRSEFDSDGNGDPELVEVHEYDELGNLVETQRDNDGGGTVDEITTREFDENGNEIRTVRDFTDPGTPDQITTNTYDEFGNITESVVTDGGGNPVRSTKLFYDENSNWIRSEDDSDGDGMTDFILTNEYEPGGFLSTFTSNTG